MRRRLASDGPLTSSRPRRPPASPSFGPASREVLLAIAQTASRVGFDPSESTPEWHSAPTMYEMGRMGGRSTQTGGMPGRERVGFVEWSGRCGTAESTRRDRQGSRKSMRRGSRGDAGSQTRAREEDRRNPGVWRSTNRSPGLAAALRGGCRRKAGRAQERGHCWLRFVWPAKAGACPPRGSVTPT